MIKNIYSCIFLFFLLLSCDQKISAPDPAISDITIEEARKAYEKLYAGSRSVNDRYGKYNVFWDMNKSEDLKYGKTLLVPIWHDKLTYVMYRKQKEKINVNLLSKLMVYKDRSGEVVFRVVRSFPDKEYVASGLHFKEGADYSGVILIEDMQGEIVEGFKYADGKFEGDVILKPGKNRVSDSGQICVTTEWYDCYYQTRVSAISNTSNCVFTGSFTTCYSIEVGGGSGGVGGGSGSNVGNPVTYTQSIRDNFTDPCLSYVLNNMMTNGLNTILSNILNNFDNNNYGTIDFENASIGPSGRAATTETIDPVLKKYKIVVNDNAITGASQEFIAAVLAHEILHAYFGSEYGTWDFSASSEHTIMSAYVNEIAVFVNSIYGIGVGNATALGWAGLHGTPAWDRLDSLDQNFILGKIYHYKNDNGTRANAPGTRCP